MKIFIAGSMHFAKEFPEANEFIEELGHEAYFAPDTHDCVENPLLNEDIEHCEAIDIMRACMNEQEKCDAILLLNHKKGGLSGYIGAHSLMELGLAYYLNQRIFLLHPLPSKQEARYHVEVAHMKPTVLNGELKNILNYI